VRAVVWTAYGPPHVLQLREIAKPVPKADEVLIRIHDTTVTTGDCEMRRMQPALRYRLLMRLYVGLAKPQRITGLGMELAGRIEAAGARVRRFKEGDRVFAATGFARVGTCAEYICLSEEPDGGALARMPANMSYEQAAAVPVGGLEALHFLRRAKIQPGERVLIRGAGGTIGCFAVQLAKQFGADVTAVDRGATLDTLRSIGADHVIDHTREDFTRNGQSYDVLFDVVGKSPLSRSLRSLNRGGRYLSANPPALLKLRGRLLAGRGRVRVITGAATAKTEDLIHLKRLIEAGKLRTVVDRVFPLEDVPEAHRYVETGQKIGNVIIAVGGDGNQGGET